MGGEGASGTGAHRFGALVVDDEPLYASAIARELERRGVTCDVAHDGAQALSLAEAGSYDVVLLDHRLPDDDGIRLIPLLREHLASAAVIMMTAYGTIPNAIRAMRQGAEDYVVKETDLRPLVGRVIELLENARPVERGGAQPLPIDFVPGVDTLGSLEARLVAEALHKSGGVKTEAARLLGISRFQLLRRMDKHGITDRATRREEEPA